MYVSSGTVILFCSFTFRCESNSTEFSTSCHHKNDFHIFLRLSTEFSADPLTVGFDVFNILLVKCMTIKPAYGLNPMRVQIKETTNRKD